MALLLTDALHIPRALGDWLQTPGTEESPKTLRTSNGSRLLRGQVQNLRLLEGCKRP